MGAYAAKNIAIQVKWLHSLISSSCGSRVARSVIAGKLAKHKYLLIASECTAPWKPKACFPLPTLATVKAH